MGYPHVFITGGTQSGKTTLAHAFADSEASKDWRVRRQIIVYDPVGTSTAAGGWPESAILFDDKDAFIAYLMPYAENAREEGKETLLFIDEADEMFSNHKENTWILRKLRHYGFQVVLITQRPQLVPPSARNQCVYFYVFRLNRDDKKTIGRDLVVDGVEDIVLDPGEYLELKAGTDAYSRCNIFNQLKRGKSKWTVLEPT